ncbi:hypothetical protein Tco_0805027 [Tanacetum coccineum]
MLHVEGKLFKSRGCLLVVLRDYIGSREFTIYEMRKGCSVWSVRYLVYTDDFMNPLPEVWSIWSIIWSTVLGEREEDSCLVINLSVKVVEYNLISKTLHDIYNIRSNQLDDDDDADHNIYEFIPSFASDPVFCFLLIDVHVRRTIDQSAGGKLRNLNAEESWAFLEDLALYDNESWNDPRDFAKPIKEIALPQDVPSTSNRRLIEVETQVQRLMQDYLAPTQPTQVNKIVTPCEVCNGPYDTHDCMEVPEQTYVDYASSCTNRMGGNSMAPKSIAAISHDEREELRKKGIKSPSKFLSPKYFSPASIKELNKNPLAPKHVHFVNLIVILRANSYTKEEEDVSSTNACDFNHNDLKGKEGVKGDRSGKRK